MGKKTTKTKSESAPWAPAQPILTGAGNSILNTVNSNQGNLNSIEGGLTGGTIPGLQQQIANQGQQLKPGTDYISQTLGSNPGLANPANSYLQGSLGSDFLNNNPANSYLQAQAGGQYLNSNPYTQAMANQAGQAAGNAVNSTFSMAGRTGSGNHATDLARGVDQAQNNVFFQNYQNERGLQNQAIGQLGQNYGTAVGQQQNAANMLGSNYNAGLAAQGNAAGMLPGYGTSQYAGYAPLLGAQQLAGQLPYYGANAAGNVGGLYGGYGTQTGTQPGGWLNGLLGAGASLGSAAIMAPAFAASDIRLKTKVEKVGEARDGLGEYEWNWRADPNGARVRGVLAHEVKELRPHAFVKGFVGGVYDGVSYAALGSMA